MAEYNSLNDVPDLDVSQIDGVIGLEFTDYQIIEPWDKRAVNSQDVSSAVDNDLFSFTATQGATYFLNSRSPDEPEMILYDASGNPVAIDEDDTDGVSDKITFQAPETGTYYIDAGWVQTTDDRVVNMIVYEDVDTIDSYQPGTDSGSDSDNDDTGNDGGDDTQQDDSTDDSSDSDSKSGLPDLGGDDDGTGGEVSELSGGKVFGQYYFGTEELDTIKYDGYSSSEVSFAPNGPNGPVDDLVSEDWAITYNYGGLSFDSVDKVFDIERVEFDDNIVALDLDVMDSAGAALALTHATFGGVVGVEDAGLWVNYSDSLYYENNASGIDMDNQAINSHYVAVAQKMLDYYASDSSVENDDLVSLLAANVTNSTLEQQAYDHYVSLLNNEDYSQAEIIAFAAMSEANTSQYDTQVQMTGFAYDPESLIG
ncbi:MAG: hypothetical protein RI556_12260 [Hydrogenovibrio sp.]|uniref:hypothetical protein n=1 Tax=Hydrogenovibrio sp. TaxID=2065821 RepID=UPI00286FC931|nr:hypothetical protein [Hydrogenovibrio sp.]MDR9499942.1 hypothetical protein [Hydrogenovibrio sp.]